MTHGQIFDDIFLSSFGTVIPRTQQMTNEEELVSDFRKEWAAKKST